MRKVVGFVGLGRMGRPMAMNVLEAGFRLLVHDVDRAAAEALRGRGAEVAGSVEKLGASCDLVITMLPDPKTVREVVLGPGGLIESLRPGSILVEMSTSDPALTREIGKALAERDVRIVDAPVAKGIPAAEDGTLTIMAGGDAKDVDECRAVLECMGNQVFHCGALGTGHVAKIVNNLLVGVLVPICAESLALGVKAGVDADVLMDVTTAGSGSSFVLDKLIRRHMLRNDYEGVFPVDYMIKDMRLALDLAGACHVPLLFGGLAHQLYETAHNQGFDRECYVIVARIVEELAGVAVRARNTNDNEEQVNVEEAHHPRRAHREPGRA